jgi:hypothetical protein
MRVVTVGTRVEDLVGLFNELRKAEFSVRNVGAEAEKTHVYLEDSEEKDPTPVVESWVGRPKPEPAAAPEKPARKSLWKKLVEKWDNL